MTSTRRLLFYLFSVVLLMNYATGDIQLDTYTDDEDLTNLPEEFSGSGDSPSEGDTGVSMDIAAIDLPPIKTGNVIQLNLPDTHQIKLKESQNTDNQRDKNKNVVAKKSKKNKEKVTSKIIKSKKYSIKKSKKDKKDKTSSKKRQKDLKHKPEEGKTINLSEFQPKKSVLLKKLNEKKTKKVDSKDVYIRRNIQTNSHQEQRQKSKNKHHQTRHKKRWRKNMDSNSHGFGRRGSYKKRKKMTFEERWPGCFQIYESCYRDNNCCDKHCHHFSWLSFGFCL